MKLFVWDFHGVLESGTENTVFHISNQVLADFGYSERFTRNENHNLFGRKWFEYYEYLLPSETHERHPALQQASFKMSDGRPDRAHKEAAADYKITDLREILREV